MVTALRYPCVWFASSIVVGVSYYEPRHEMQNHKGWVGQPSDDFWLPAEYGVFLAMAPMTGGNDEDYSQHGCKK
jgi:hypothetical protein